MLRFHHGNPCLLLLLLFFTCGALAFAIVAFHLNNIKATIVAYRRCVEKLYLSKFFTYLSTNSQLHFS